MSEQKSQITLRPVLRSSGRPVNLCLLWFPPCSTLEATRVSWGPTSFTMALMWHRLVISTRNYCLGQPPCECVACDETILTFVWSLQGAGGTVGLLAGLSCRIEQTCSGVWVGKGAAAVSTSTSGCCVRLSLFCLLGAGGETLRLALAACLLSDGLKAADGDWSWSRFDSGPWLSSTWT